MLTVIGIANYLIKQHITIYIGGYYRAVDVVAQETADSSRPTGKVEVASNFK